MAAGTSVVHLMARSSTAVHVALLRATKGKMGAGGGEGKMAVLTTTGAKSGHHRSTVVMAIPDGDGYLVIASNAGRPHHPAWYHNLRAHPEARLELNGKAIDLRGRVATPEERAKLWPDIVARFSGYGRYQEKTSREIPVVILEPATAAGEATGAPG